MEILRYRYDDPSYYGLSLEDSSSAGWLNNRALSQDLRISEGVLPRLHKASLLACQRLGISAHPSVFVYASPELNAHVHTDTKSDRVLIRISSGIINHLDADEWLFVLGHELGHDSLEHHRYPAPDESDQTRLFHARELQRSAEISADRAGFVACDDLDIALRAMLKIATGLNTQHFDISLSDYMMQLSTLRDSRGDEFSLFYSHPPFPVRVRAVMRFDSLRRDLAAGGNTAELALRIDDEIQSDMDAAACGSGGNSLSALADRAAFWSIVETMCKDGVFRKEDQARLETGFGPERVSKLKDLLTHSPSRNHALSTIHSKTRDAQQDLAAAPTVARRLCANIMKDFHQRATGPC